MNKILKSILIFIMFFLCSIVDANQTDIYWEEAAYLDIYQEDKINNLDKTLNDFYKKTWLNTDVVILGKWDSCYLNKNFDSCIQVRKNYSSDLVIVLSMKSDIKSRWDIRTLVKDQFKEIMTPLVLKTHQDMITHHFKNNNFINWLESYLSSLENFISSKCSEVWVVWECNAQILSKQYNDYLSKKTYEAKYNAMMRNIYLWIWFIIFVALYLFILFYYRKQTFSLYKDVKFYIWNLSEYKIFENDRNLIKAKFENQETEIRNRLWNLSKSIFRLRSYYNDNAKIFEENIKELSFMQKSFSEKWELKDKVSEMKKINL